MLPKSESLIKLNSIARFLKLSGKFLFVNYNLKLFYDFINNDSEIGTIIQKLLLKYPTYEQDAKDVLGNPNQNIYGFRSKGTIVTFESWVAFCLFYIKVATEISGGNPVIQKVISQYDGSGYDKERKDVTQFFNDIIEPILIYIELQIQQTQNTLYILQRYKVLCEWHCREELLKEDEVSITKNHLSRYLFDQGFTYSLSETTMPSGRIDNFAINIGLKNKHEFGSLPEAIIAEGKIYTGQQKVVQDVRNQINKRMEDLGFLEGFCVLFNKTSNQISFSVSDKGGSVGKYSSGFYILSTSNKTTYFIVVNLDVSFEKSPITNEEVVINLI